MWRTVVYPDYKSDEKGGLSVVFEGKNTFKVFISALDIPGMRALHFGHVGLLGGSRGNLCRQSWHKPIA
jgi:hypothetical protein